MAASTDILQLAIAGVAILWLLYLIRFIIEVRNATILAELTRELARREEDWREARRRKS